MAKLPIYKKITYFIVIWQPEIKIFDFGTSRMLPDGQEFINTIKGERLAFKYLAPETIHKKILSKNGCVEFWSTMF
ncbi:unnamed protein product [Meloidogyne enterolobii]|uniref:Uncharacterized protein n=1 Tax=Meloidogyne enterolobii TaxID=390850 RepID=A0ACB0XZ85_MELEN